MPRDENPETSPKGSMTTVVPFALRRKADWPYHSTCMLLLRLSCQVRRGERRAGGCVRVGLVRVVIAAAPHQRGARCGEARDDREREGRVKPGAERPGDEVREEGAAREHRVIVCTQGGERVRAEAGPDRAVAEEAREQDGHRGEMGHLGGCASRDALRLE